MEVAQTLIRTVARAFYETRSILVIDALFMHSTLWVDDLANVLSMNTKDLRKLCGLLREDKMITVHQRSEQRPGTTRAQTKEYYYIDYHLAIDAIKIRVVRLQKKVQDLYAPSLELKDFSCPRCKGQFTEMEALTKAWHNGGMDFPCPTCETPLNRTETSAADRAGSVRSGLLLKQLDKLVGSDGLLREIDRLEIPQNAWPDALARQKKIDRTDGSIEHDWKVVKPDAQNATVHGIKSQAPDIEVAFMTREENEKEEAEKKRQRLAQQQSNALPSWHTQSTVTGDKTALGDAEEARLKEIGATLKAEDDPTSATSNVPADNNQYISDYYNLLQAQASQKKEDGSDEDDEEDDEDDGFEDVIPAATPADSSTGIKRKADDSDVGSGLNTAVSTPAFADSPSKRVKVEESAADADDDDEDEFEDAL